MKLAGEEARVRLATHDHGILCTVHPARGADAVPVVFAVDGEGFLASARRPGEAEGVRAAATGTQPRGRSARDPPGGALGPRRLVPAVVGASELRHVTEPQPGRVADIAALLAARYPQYRP